MLSPSLAPSLAPSFARQYSQLEAQTSHRLTLLNTFSIPPSSHILEIGCGQGDCTAVLAHLLSLDPLHPGHVDAIDPAPLDYGAPVTLGEAQENLKKTDIGERIRFARSDPVEWLGGVEKKAYDGIVMCHCLWYFSTEEDVHRTFAAARGKGERLYIAEWSLETCLKEGEAHVLTATTRALCESYIPDSDQNIRLAIAPERIKEIAVGTGWELEREEMVTPGRELEDAGWEVGMLLGRDGSGREFLERARERIEDEGVVGRLEGMVEEVQRMVEHLGGRGGVRCMDVWVGVFG
ncbi:hypothetical protein P154DRAFT_494758 [Amniculicola lignicola CBS 123094]|uniref:Uncharacterized protein n=1 Tax=Amniculicola lignicola CBS 123094 TaxID=1392246 RepID=A0A6A5WA05_9PLEO|nr:hypothetical protein P154DRAFT_494758 [Amniculicola lignicola CBS 123094]